MLQIASGFLKINNLIVMGGLVFGGLLLFYLWLRISAKLKHSLSLHLNIQRIIDFQLQATPQKEKEQVKRNLILETKKREKELLFEIKKRDDEIIRLTNAIRSLEESKADIKVGNERETLRLFIIRQMAKMEISTFRKEFAFFFFGLIGQPAISLLWKLIVLSYKLLAST